MCNVIRYRYMIYFYCLVVQAGFYSDVVECRTLSPTDRVRSPVGENVISIFSPVTFGPHHKYLHDCVHKTPCLISCDSWTPRNSGTNFNLEGENVTGYWYMIHLYCLAIQAGFYRDPVKCRTLSPTGTCYK